MENNKRKLTERQAIVLALYRKGLTQEQIAEKLYGDKYLQGSISRHLHFCKQKGYGKEIDEIKEKNANKFIEPLTDLFLKAKKELEGGI